MIWSCSIPQMPDNILGICQGYASDLVVDVFHENEAEALLPDLAAAFPWPVRVTTRREAAGIYSAGLARRSGLVYMTLIPAVLALAFIVAGAGKNHSARRYEAGLYKAFGWTTPDIFRLQLLKALLSGVPAVSCGLVPCLRTCHVARRVLARIFAVGVAAASAAAVS